MRNRFTSESWLAVRPGLRVMLVWFGAFALAYLVMIPRPHWWWSVALALTVTWACARFGVFHPQRRLVSISLSVLLPPLVIMAGALGLFKILPSDLPEVLSHDPLEYDVPSSPTELRDALYSATHRGDALAVERLLARGAPPDLRRRRRGPTPLVVAARRGHARIAALLIAAGADPNPQVKVLDHPVVWAVRANDSQLLTLLLEAAGARLPAAVREAARSLAVLEGNEQLLELLDERSGPPRDPTFR